jgi:hypothetical protein
MMRYYKPCPLPEPHTQPVGAMWAKAKGHRCVQRKELPSPMVPVEGVLIEDEQRAAVERMLPALQGFFDEWDGATRRPDDNTLRSLARLAVAAVVGGEGL